MFRVVNPDGSDQYGSIVQLVCDDDSDLPFFRVLFGLSRGNYAEAPNGVQYDWLFYLHEVEPLEKTDDPL